MSSPNTRRRAAALLFIVCLACLPLAAATSAYAARGIGWGFNGFGVLGTESNIGPETCSPFPCSRFPTAVDKLGSLTQIASGQYHTLALLADGAVVAWGDNSEGELGNGTSEESVTPVPVSGLANVVQVAAGWNHSLALLADGTVMTWGDNRYGQLGNGSTVGPDSCGIYGCSRVPVSVPGLSGVVAIAAGEYFDLALRADGSVAAWGQDTYGAAGDGNGVLTGCECVASPNPVPGVSGAVAISAGKFAMALLADGSVRDWGYNLDGALGNGTSNEAVGTCFCLGAVQPNGISGVKAISAGTSHALALLADGTLKAWGANGYGELGNGGVGPENCSGDPCSRAPVTVNGLSAPVAIAAGSGHSMALLAGGTVNAWGYNYLGQLGDGTSESSSTPVAVSGVSSASGISANNSQSFALFGPSQALTVSLAGSGAGTVGGPAGIICPSACSANYPQGAFETLRAEPASGSGFAGFSGPCTGTGPCHVTMSQDQQVTATFGPPTGTAITRAKVSSAKKSASFSFTAPGAITGFECELIRPKPHRRHRRHHGKRKSARAAKSAKPRFSACGPAKKAYKHLRPGRYTFKVRALDILGADANPAKKRFAIRQRIARRHARFWARRKPSRGPKQRFRRSSGI